MLEGASAFLVNMPLKILGRLLMTGAWGRIIWATGCTALHPRPPLEAFWNFEMPEHLIAGYGYQALSPQLKQAILGGNIARILALEVAKRTNGALAEPWSV